MRSLITNCSCIMISLTKIAFMKSVTMNPHVRLSLFHDWGGSYTYMLLSEHLFYLVPSSAKRKARRCLGCLCSILAISEKLAKAVFFVPTLTTLHNRSPIRNMFLTLSNLGSIILKLCFNVYMFLNVQNISCIFIT